MSVSSEIVTIRGQRVLIHEGDLLCTRSTTSMWARAVALVSAGISHVNTVVRIQGRLVALSVCSNGWTDEHGNYWNGGVTTEPLWLFGSSEYDRLWVVSPSTPRTEDQLNRLRLKAAELIRDSDGSGGAIYDGWGEFFNSFAGLPRRTKKKYHCGELAAELANAQGLWPSGVTTSAPLTVLVSRLGQIRRIF